MRAWPTITKFILSYSHNEEGTASQIIAAPKCLDNCIAFSMVPAVVISIPCERWGGPSLIKANADDIPLLIIDYCPMLEMKEIRISRRFNG
jgi:hypothetical protein